MKDNCNSMNYLIKSLVSVLVLCVFLSCGDGKKYHDAKENTVLEAETNTLASILAFQEKLNQEFRDPKTSPLPDRYRKDFEALDFFAPDTTYTVWAKLTRTPDAVPFLMPTNTDRLSKELVYGTLTFTLKGKSYQLEVYQNEELLLEEGFEDYLFLPFTDATNGKETYGGGRYIDLRIPEADSIKIDFNMAYNPYCAYNKKYSCPLVPAVNALKVPVYAGVKAFLKE